MASTHAVYCSMVTAGICRGGAAGFSGRLCCVAAFSHGATIVEGGARGGLGLGMATAAATASRSMPASLAPNCSRAETALQRGEN